MTEPRIWVLVDGISGHESQSLGVAEALGLPFETRKIAHAGLAGQANALGLAALGGLTPEAKAGLKPPWPEIVIAAGRRLAPVARAIKRKCAGAAKLVQIMDPGRGFGAFDLVAAPRHDGCRARDNLIETTGAPNRVTAAKLSAGAQSWRAKCEDIPKPFIALLLGGSTRRRPFGPALAAELGGKASVLAGGAGGSLLVLTSRRTEADAIEALAGAIDVAAHIHRFGQGRENPYYGFLGLADAIIVTGDSMSMCSEACTTGKPVYIFAPPAIVKPAFARLHQELFDLSMARPLGEAFEAWTYPRLDAASEIAAEIRKRFGLPAARNR
ncbi:MAG: mitochondrial fission ELM1 family protein [Alphaproteobacteria bacterium]|nr:mitochondrial fission ELM1 family protein [Alphaproteobacteria bacterium]